MATLVDSGLEYIPKIMGGISTDIFKYVALDKGETVEGNDKTALVDEIVTADAVGGVRKLADTVEYEADYKLKLIVSWTFADAVTINGCGIFDVVTEEGGHMLMIHAFSSGKPVDNGDTLQLTLKYTQSRAA
jgi:hypothetical protein